MKSEGVMKNLVYYSIQYDVIIIAEFNGKEIWCYDIFGKTSAALSESEFALDKSKLMFPVMSYV